MAFTESFTNLGSCTLLSAYTAGDGTLHVSSTTGDDVNYPFPTSVPFRLSVFDTSNNFQVIFKVTTITDGTHFAGVAEGHDANALINSICTGTQTAASLTALRTDAGTDANLTLSDITTNNVSITAHGFAPKAPSDATKFLNGANPPAWAVPAGGSATPGGSNTQLQYNNSGAFGGTTGATTSGGAVTLVAPVLGTPASGTLTNCTGTASGLTSGITNALKSATTTVDVSAATAPTSGQVLTATAGTTATWQTPGLGAGSFVLLEQHTASSSATLDFTTCITSTYDEYQIELVNIIPATNAVSLWFRASTNGGSTYDSSSIYDFTGFRFNVGGATSTDAATSQAQIIMDGMNGGDFVSNSATRGICGTYRLFSPLSTSVHKVLNGGPITLLATSSAVMNGAQLASIYRSTTAVNAFRILFSSGNIASGIVRVYGIAK